MNKESVPPSEWKRFPDPGNVKCWSLQNAPGCYELRREDCGQNILGVGGHLAVRTTFILPRPYGCGTGKNDAKRAFVLANIKHVGIGMRGSQLENGHRNANGE